MHKTEEYSHREMRGKLAVCSRGILGLISSDHPKKVKYPDGNEGVAYVGIAVYSCRPWSSRNPKVVGTIKEFADSGLTWDAWLASRGFERRDAHVSSSR